jgi:hypothetical protein
MSREARFCCVWIIAVFISAATGCSHKPAYSDIDANRAAAKQDQNQSNANQPATPSAAASQPSAAEPPTPSPPAPAAPPAPPAHKNPTFLDEVKGGVKDLPSYPGAQRVSVQIGPVEGVNTMAIGLRTTDSMDKIALFYDQAIKTNKWTVVDKIVDPELSEWNLKKGEGNSGKVQVKKDVKTNIMNIVIVRGEKLEDPSKQGTK